MSTINERIMAAIEAIGVTKTDVANKLKLSQAFISKLTVGNSTPSDRTIQGLCKEYNINESWLRTGKGEMFNSLSRDEQLASFMGQVLAGESDNFKRRLLTSLSKLDEADWEALEKIALKIKEG